MAILTWPRPRGLKASRRAGHTHKGTFYYIPSPPFSSPLPSTLLPPSFPFSINDDGRHITTDPDRKGLRSSRFPVTVSILLSFDLQCFATPSPRCCFLLSLILLLFTAFSYVTASLNGDEVSTRAVELAIFGCCFPSIFPFPLFLGFSTINLRLVEVLERRPTHTTVFFALAPPWAD
jgi:hypothetical protein